MREQVIFGSGNIQVENLSAGYAGVPALDRVSFSIQQGERVAVIGPNGAGKSTLFKALVGLIPAQTGRF